MKILVLGNGFDLDHDLPTSYKHFLFFCLYLCGYEWKKDKYYKELTLSQHGYLHILEKSEDKETFLELIKNNHILNYISSKLIIEGENWIDFEREIKGIVKEIRILELNYMESNDSFYELNGQSRVMDLIQRLDLSDCIINGKIHETMLEEIHKQLKKSLDNLSKALEVYIDWFIDTTEINGISPDIIEFDATNIISFNYSRTYERVYGGTHWHEDVNHIHGIANSKRSTSPNIVLGITTVDNMQKSNRYVDFEKYYQRITKKTGSLYSEWLSRERKSKTPIEVTFFGHSLDSSDSDIIIELICNPNTKVTILYFNENAHQIIVSNLIETIGKERLIEYVSGRNPKIIFKQQKEHQKDTTAGVEIEKDIRKIYKLYTLSKKEIEELTTKLENKIENKDISYFYSQRKIIDLFEAMEYTKINKRGTEGFLELCRMVGYKVENGSRIKAFKYEEWYGETAWGATIECEPKTKVLIDLVNELNVEYRKEEEKNEQYAFIYSINNAENMKEALLKIFNENPTREYWKMLTNMLYSHMNISLVENALNDLNNEQYPIHIASKAQRLLQVLEEVKYENYLEEMYREDCNNYME